MPFPSDDLYPAEDLYPGAYRTFTPNPLLPLPRTFKRWWNGAWELTITSYAPIDISSAGEAEALGAFRASDGTPALITEHNALGTGTLGSGTLGDPEA